MGYFVVNNLWILGVLIFAMFLFALLAITEPKNDAKKIFHMKCSCISLVLMGIFFVLIVYFDAQFSLITTKQAKIVKLENITEKGANVTYTLDGVLSSGYYTGTITVAPSDKEATVTCDILENLRGIKRTDLREITVPEEFFK